MIETLLRNGRAYHDSESERLAGELEEAARAPIEPRLWPQFLDLANHTIGEHLNDWLRARALAERVLDGKSPDPTAASAWGKLAAARFMANDPSAALVAETEYLCAAGENLRDALIESRVALVNAMIGSKRVAEAAKLYEAILGVARSGTASTADRGVAVASSNLATDLVERTERSAAEDALMRTAADAGLEFWLRCGTWVNEERGLYLLALVDNALGEPARALARIDTALAIIEANGDEPVDVVFLRLARANACAQLRDVEGHKRDLEASDAVAATWEKPGLKSWYSEERARIHKL